ncbi:MAG: fused MFS/spermidine synthase, partial [Acidobacteria bacterium]|nr:fused MFS/spermidine synthase [Acidobacteriota bacterium]
MHRDNAAPYQLLILALLSGAAALSLELLWARQLALTFGSSHYAVTTTLAGFLLGMGVGSFFGGRIADRVHKPIRWLAGAELTLAVLGPLLTVGLIRLPNLAARLLPEVSVTEPSALLSRFVLALIVMSPATVLMGATFPLMARSISGGPAALHRALPLLYGINTLGGVFGVIFSSFYVLPNYGVLGIAAAAAFANAAASVFGLWISRHAGSQAGAATVQSLTVKPDGSLILLLAGLSGGAVLAGETLWNRILGIVLPNSTFTFALLLALYLGGLAIGGLGASRLMRRPDPLKLWALFQAAAASWVLLSLVLLPKVSLWVRHIRPPSGWGRVLMTPLAVGGGLILPAVILLGAAWPLLLAAGTPRVEDGGRRIGLMGMTNAIGAALGGAFAGWWIVPALGIGRSLIVLAAFHGLLAAVGAGKVERPGTFKVLGGTAALLLLLGLLLPSFGRIALPSTVEGEALWHTVLYREGPTGTVTVLEDPSGGRRSMFVDNSAVIGTTYDALKVVRMLGLLPTLLHPRPDDVLVIGYGAGVTTAMLAASPSVHSIDVREIIPAVVEASPLFDAVNHDVLQSPKVRLGYGDGRNFLLLTDRAWDVITCDPVHPLYGSAPLYSLEFFKLCRKRLRVGGQMYQYLPLHHMPPIAFRQAIGTFSAVFPHTRVAFTLGHAVLIGSDQPIEMDWQTWADRLLAFEEPSDLV